MDLLDKIQLKSSTAKDLTQEELLEVIALDYTKNYNKDVSFENALLALDSLHRRHGGFHIKIDKGRGHYAFHPRRYGVPMYDSPGGMKIWKPISTTSGGMKIWDPEEHDKQWYIPHSEGIKDTLLTIISKPYEITREEIGHAMQSRPESLKDVSDWKLTEHRNRIRNKLREEREKYGDRFYTKGLRSGKHKVLAPGLGNILKFVGKSILPEILHPEKIEPEYSGLSMYDIQSKTLDFLHPHYYDNPTALGTGTPLDASMYAAANLLKAYYDDATSEFEAHGAYYNMEGPLRENQKIINEQLLDIIDYYEKENNE